MLHTRRTLALTLAAGIAALAAPAMSRAQAWPTRPISWIVPFAAGGPTDALARDIADHTGRQLGQTILIDNAAGAGGTIGSTKAARAAPDGYTFLVGHMGYMGAAPALYKKLAYDPVKDFEPVLRMPDTPLVLLVSTRSPYGSAAELIAYAKQNPGKLNFGNAGVGSTSHLVAALFASRAGIRITQVAYKGAGPAMNDLIAGQVDAMFDQTNTALPQVGARLKAIGLTSEKEMSQFPGVPTLGATVLPGFETSTWFGLYAPRGTPKEIVSKMSDAYLKALEDKAWTQKMAAQGIRLLPTADASATALGQHTASEVERWKKVAAEAHISLD
ncbi:tripartite tricarboxylate transporter substrate binding protein BugD [Xylophilus rhododendri]|uniref:Tripartite tricarboxylate transporter substrate binding protein BugD n=1 Tax=Xylophilus rhododendri TaxID=2697032 RepID=A0A857JE93_9BURK|nr:tripartite tricarboxylate transporter substrate-binding protein [Xylophilus rhododendri]QHJ01263.1 tripartite tricarboxylate transporter substrate binding protein BugD [Xylophilus rhododendri]